MFRLVFAPSILSRRPGLLAAGLLLPLALGAAPARAATLVISSPVTGPLTIGPGDKVTLVDGGSVTASDTAIVLNGGTLNVSGGSITTGNIGVLVLSGTLKISGGSISAPAGLIVRGGTAHFSAGSVSIGGTMSNLPA
jgi:hypothetical protein